MLLLSDYIEPRLGFISNEQYSVKKNSLLPILCKLSMHGTAWKVSKYGVISGPYFPVFELNMEIYGVNLRIQPKYRRIRTRNNSVFGRFSHSGHVVFVQTFNACHPFLIISQTSEKKNGNNGLQLKITTLQLSCSLTFLILLIKCIRLVLFMV